MYRLDRDDPISLVAITDHALVISVEGLILTYSYQTITQWRETLAQNAEFAGYFNLPDMGETRYYRDNDIINDKEIIDLYKKAITAISPEVTLEIKLTAIETFTNTLVTQGKRIPKLKTFFSNEELSATPKLLTTACTQILTSDISSQAIKLAAFATPFPDLIMPKQIFADKEICIHLYHQALTAKTFAEKMNAILQIKALLRQRNSFPLPKAKTFFPPQESALLSVEKINWYTLTSLAASWQDRELAFNWFAENYLNNLWGKTRLYIWTILIISITVSFYRKNNFIPLIETELLLNLLSYPALFIYAWENGLRPSYMTESALKTLIDLDYPLYDSKYNDITPDLLGRCGSLLQRLANTNQDLALLEYAAKKRNIQMLGFLAVNNKNFLKDTHIFADAVLNKDIGVFNSLFSVWYHFAIPRTQLSNHHFIFNIPELTNVTLLQAAVYTIDEHYDLAPQILMPLIELSSSEDKKTALKIAIQHQKTNTIGIFSRSPGIDIAQAYEEMMYPFPEDLTKESTPQDLVTAMDRLCYEATPELTALTDQLCWTSHMISTTSICAHSLAIGHTNTIDADTEATIKSLLLLQFLLAKLGRYRALNTTSHKHQNLSTELQQIINPEPKFSAYITYETCSFLQAVDTAATQRQYAREKLTKQMKQANLFHLHNKGYHRYPKHTQKHAHR